MRLYIILVTIIVLSVSSARAQSFEASVSLAAAGLSEFDGTDYGIGGRVTWKASPLIGVDADFTWYPGEFPSEPLFPFSESRVEGLVGVTVGPRLNRVRPFARAAAGFLKFSAPSEGFACVAIFPPPLPCLLAAGPTLAAVEIGGGVELPASSNAFVRVDIADRLLKYPGPTFVNGLSERRDGGFWGHALRFSLGAGIRF